MERRETRDRGSFPSAYSVHVKLIKTVLLLRKAEILPRKLIDPQYALRDHQVGPRESANIPSRPANNASDSTFSFIESEGLRPISGL